MLKKTLSLFLAAIIIISCTFTLSSCGNEPANEPDTSETASSQAETADENVNPLTGMPGYSSEYLGKKMIGVVVENSPDARPQWGLSTPDIVFEYEVEGGISRMLWLYANESTMPEKIGPVRSARHDIVELALGYDMLFIHCGGSDIAYNTLEGHLELDEIDGMNSYSFFVRDTQRNVASEHRLCLITDSFKEALPNLSVDMNVDEAKAQPFKFASSNSPRVLNGNDCDKIDFYYSGNYHYTFTFDEATRLYNCNLNGNSRVDDAGIQCAYSNVIVLYTDMVDTGDSAHHQDLKLENGGNGYYLNGGECEAITWTKGGTNDMLKLFAADGSELVLNCGNSYIGLVRSTQASNTSMSVID